MKNVLGIIGAMLILLALQLFSADDGLRAAILFLGVAMCAGVVLNLVHPVLEQIVADNSRDHYLKLYEVYMEKQQETMKRIEQEMMKRKQLRD